MKYVKFAALVLAISLAVLTSFVPPDSPQESMAQEEEAACSPIDEEMAAEFLDRFNAIFDEPDFDIADEIFAEDFVAHLPLAPELDREGWKEYVGAFYTGISDLHVEEVSPVIVGDNLLAWHFTSAGTHDGPLFGVPATDTAVLVNNMGIICFNDDGLAIEGWGLVDLVGLLAQIGAFPPVE